MMAHGRMMLNRRQLIAPISLAATTVACAVVAALASWPVWAATLGAGLCFAYWGLEVLAWRRGEASPTFGAALGVALGGMVLRLALVLGVLVLVGIFARPAFATAALSFLCSFSVYVGVRLFTYPGVQGPAGQAEAR